MLDTKLILHHLKHQNNSNSSVKVNEQIGIPTSILAGGGVPKPTITSPRPKSRKRQQFQVPTNPRRTKPPKQDQIRDIYKLYKQVGGQKPFQGPGEPISNFGNVTTAGGEKQRKDKIDRGAEKEYEKRTGTPITITRVADGSRRISGGVANLDNFDIRKGSDDIKKLQARIKASQARIKASQENIAAMDKKAGRLTSYSDPERAKFYKDRGVVGSGEFGSITPQDRLNYFATKAGQERRAERKSFGLQPRTRDYQLPGGGYDYDAIRADVRPKPKTRPRRSDGRMGPPRSMGSGGRPSAIMGGGYQGVG